MFEPMIQAFSALDSFGLRHPFRLMIALFAIGFLLLLIRRNFVSFNDVEQRRAFERSVKLRRILIFISRSVIIASVCMVFAGPFVLFPDLVASEPKLVVLVDQTPSMTNSDTSGLDGFISEIGSRIATQIYPLERSSWDAVRSYVQQGTPLLIASDGMLSGDGLAIARYAQALNASINVIDLPPIEPDLGVSIESPELTAARVETPFLVRVSGNSEAKETEYRLIITVDDTIVRNVSGTGPNTFELSLLLDEGEKLITARLDVEDAFRKNNVAATPLVVANKPRVHLVTRDRTSPLVQVLEELYTLTVSSTIPDLSSVSALVLDDLPARVLDARFEDLSDFVIDGGGLVVVGGTNSYDRGDYKGSRIETILPVISQKGVPEGEGAISAVLIIDMSASTGQVFRDGAYVTIADVIKSGSVSVYDALKESDTVGVVAFNTEARTLQEFSVKNEHIKVTDRIRSLVFMGGTYIHTGIGASASMLAKSSGTRYAILFSDGESQSVRYDRDAAIALRNLGITLHTVSVGEGSDRDHLFELARLTGGTHFEPDETSKFEILFGTHDEPSEEGPSVFSLVTWDSNHFVSSGLSLGSSLYGLNDVSVKPSAQRLVVTTSNNPIVASSFFGLGRIVSIATDNGNEWSGEVFSNDAMLFARAVNYALGDASKQQDFFVRATDPREGEPFEILVFSAAHIPSIEVDGSTVLLSEIDEGEYRGELSLSEGAYDIGPRSIVVNHPREYVYPKTSMASVSFASSGSLFNTQDVSRVETFAIENSFESSSRIQPIGAFFLFFAAILFLIEVVIRRLTERHNQ
jgi:uncharacterized membrane protein